MRAVLLLVASWTVACSTSPVGATSDAGEDAAEAGAADVAAPSGCPSVVPAQGSPCAPANLACEWGGDAHHACTTFASCENRVWNVTPPKPDCGTNAPACPATYDARAPGSACPFSATAGCTYPEGRCACVTCTGGAPDEGVWECEPWEVTGCPLPRPLLGSACEEEGLSCPYMHCCSVSVGYNQGCFGGSWVVVTETSCACTERFCPADAGAD